MMGLVQMGTCYSIFVGVLVHGVKAGYICITTIKQEVICICRFRRKSCLLNIKVIRRDKLAQCGVNCALITFLVSVRNKRNQSLAVAQKAVGNCTSQIGLGLLRI